MWFMEMDNYIYGTVAWVSTYVGGVLMLLCLTWKLMENCASVGGGVCTGG
jgi:hypothetical protein